ncbi:MAG TPA: 16S rRNA (cytidine(1402)-2'-O)-methyltransferase [Chthonomonadaceae bacterium]|nr:16S rRNA (cytidine(1402)-2'-O)-methyltransferase [Chthonomonadaceae bacterium]
MLTLVATPIGNLNDITLRALDTLRAADLIASEDTRKTGLLLKHFGIQKPQISYHEHNEERASERILALLAEGKSVAVVTNAGTPGISDPGFTLVRKALAAEIAVTMAPGPTALIMALVLSGLPVHSFTFRGFPPRKSGPRRRFFEVDRDSPHTLIFYESPYRLDAFLEDALAVYGDRPAALANDLTKRFEKVLRGRLSELRSAVSGEKAKGEYIFVIAGKTPPRETLTPSPSPTLRERGELNTPPPYEGGGVLNAPPPYEGGGRGEVAEEEADA